MAFCANSFLGKFTATRSEFGVRTPSMSIMMAMAISAYVGYVRPSRFSRSPNFDVITCETGQVINNPESHSKNWRQGTRVLDSVKHVKTISRNQ